IEDEARFAEYTKRLADAGLAGIGFGIGLRWDEVPGPMITVADEMGLPVIEIPLSAPWVAISEAVSRVQSDERAAAAARALEGQRALTAAAVAGGGPEVLEECARRTGGWAALVDAAGTLLHGTSPAAAEALPGL